MKEWKILKAKVSEDGSAMEVEFYHDECRRFTMMLPADGWYRMLQASAAVSSLAREHVRHQKAYAELINMSIDTTKQGE